MKLRARYKLIQSYALEPLNATELIKVLVSEGEVETQIEVEVPEVEVENLKRLMSHYKFGEAYLGELAWYLGKVRELALAEKKESEKRKILLERWYLGQTYFQEVEQDNLSIEEIHKLYVKRHNEAKNFTEAEIIAIVRKTAKDFKLLEKLFFTPDTLNEITFGFVKSEKITIKATVNGVYSISAQRIIKEGLSKYFLMEGAKTVETIIVKDGEIVKQSINSSIKLPPSLKYIIDLIGIDDQNKNKSKVKNYRILKDYISNLYRFLDFHFPFTSEYGILDFIAGLFYFAGYDFKLLNYTSYEIGKNNQEYREFIEKRVDNDLMATIQKRIRANSKILTK